MEAPQRYSAEALPGLALCHHNVQMLAPVEAGAGGALGGVAGHVPLVAALVSCGFPSPADDHAMEVLDLHELLVRNPPATFYIRAMGESMAPLIDDGDLCVIDRSLSPKRGDIVVACVDGAFTLKRLVRNGPLVELVPENPAYPPIRLRGEMTLEVFGVVTFTVKTLRRNG